MQRWPLNRASVVEGALLTAAALAGAWLAGDRVRSLLWVTASVAAPASLLAMALALPVAVVATKSRVAGRGAAALLIASLLLLPAHVVAGGWLATADASDWLTTPATADSPSWALFDGRRGAVLLHGLAGAPWAAVFSVAALGGVDPRREEQALLEASPLRVLRAVTLPAAAPGLISAFTLVGVLAAAEIAITDLMRVRTFAEEVYTEAALGAFTGAGRFAAAGGWRMVAGAACLAAIAAMAARVIGSTAVVALTSGERSAAPLLRSGVVWALAGAAPIVLVCAPPMVGFARQVGRTTTEVEGRFERSWSASAAIAELASAPWGHRRELLVSAGVGGAVSVVTTASALALVWGARGRTNLSRLLVVIAAVAIATPGPLVGLLVAKAASVAPGPWLHDSWAPTVFAQTVRFAPLAVLLLLPIPRMTPPSVIAAARLDAAGRLATLLRVVAPLHWRLIAASLLAVFALSIGELAATSLVVPPGPPPVSVRLLSLLHYGVEERVAALSLWLVLGATLVAAAVVVWLRRRPIPPAPPAPPAESLP